MNLALAINYFEQEKKFQQVAQTTPDFRTMPLWSTPLPDIKATPTTVLAGTVAGLCTLLWVKNTFFRPKNAPPKVPSPVPFFGNIVAFGERPIDFLHECAKKVRRRAGQRDRRYIVR